MTEFNQGFARIKPPKEGRFVADESNMKVLRHTCVKISIPYGGVIPRKADGVHRRLQVHLREWCDWA